MRTLLFVFLVPAGLALAADPVVKVGPSPNARVLLSPVPEPQSSDAVLSSIFAGTREVLRPMSFYLTNQTDQAVVGLNVVWISTDSLGRQKTFRSSSDSFSSGREPRPVIKPGERILVIPGGGWESEAMLPAYAQAGHFNPIQMQANGYAQAAQVSVRIDALILADGELDGPDVFRLGDDLAARKQAAEAVVAKLTAAKANGVDPGVALADMLTPAVITNQVMAWEQRYARSALQAPTFADSYLRKLPEVPALTRPSVLADR